MAAWTEQIVAAAKSRSSGMWLIGVDGAVTSFHDLPPRRQQSFAALIQGWHELLAAGHPNCEAEANASLARWLANDGSDESEIEQLNKLRAALGLDDAGET